MAEGGEKRFKRLSTHAETPIRRHVKIKADANPFDIEWETYFEQRATNAMRKRPNGRIMSLWLRQGGICPISANIADKPLKISGEVRCVSFLLPCSTPLSPSILRLKRF
jgi:hypothetical protein